MSTITYKDISNYLRNMEVDEFGIHRIPGTDIIFNVREHELGRLVEVEDRKMYTFILAIIAWAEDRDAITFYPIKDGVPDYTNEVGRSKHLGDSVVQTDTWVKFPNGQQVYELLRDLVTPTVQ